MKYLSFLFAIAAATNLALCSDNDNSHTSYIYDSEYQDHFTSTNPYLPPSTYFVPIDTQQEIARQRIHQQCDQLAHQQQRLSSPAYSAREMSAIMCSGKTLDHMLAAYPDNDDFTATDLIPDYQKLVAKIITRQQDTVDLELVVV